MSLPDPSADEAGIPVWDGNPKNLPEQGKSFFYNWGIFSWKPCTCKPTCNRPIVFDMEGHRNNELTVLARGNNQGDSVRDVLIKAGHTPQEISKLDFDGLAYLFMELTIEAVESGNLEAFIYSKGISLIEMAVAEGILQGRSPEETLRSALF